MKGLVFSRYTVALLWLVGPFVLGAHRWHFESQLVKPIQLIEQRSPAGDEGLEMKRVLNARPFGSLSELRFGPDDW